jgi:hypothetical protein
VGSSPLRSLDDRVLPRLTRGLNRILGRAPRGADTAPAGAGRPPADAAQPPADPAATRRGRVLGSVAVLGVVAVVGTAVYVSGDTPAPDRTVGDVVRVGAVEGAQVAQYTDAARAELRGLVSAGTAEAYALVSLRGYATPAGVLPLLADVETVRVFVRLPLPQVQTPIVSFGVRTPAADIPAAMARIAAEREASATEDEKAAARLSGDDPQERALQKFYTDSVALDRAEASAYRSRCACVYAVVVKATPLRLQHLSTRAGVRVVDAAPEVWRLDRTVFLPLLPEQTTVVAPPPDRSLPAEPLVPAGSPSAG